MPNLAITNQSSLSQYSRSHGDRAYADRFESILGHLVCERGMEIKSALENLRPIVKRTRKETLTARDWCQKLGFAGVGIGILLGASPAGIGLAIPPILSGILSLKFWADSRGEVPRREAEYYLLKVCADLPEALYALNLRGVDAVRVVSAYDALVTAIESRLEDGKDFTEKEVGEFLKAKIEASTGLERKPQAIADPPPTEIQSQQFQGSIDSRHGLSPGLPQAESLSTPTSISWNPAIDLGRNPQSALIVGTPGSGKGMVVSNAIRELRKAHPKLTVMMLDPKADSKERGYWDGVVDHLSSRSARSGDPDEIMEWVLNKIQEFGALPSPKLLILDEMLQVSTVAKMAAKELKAVQRLKLAICGIVSQGDSNQEWIWLMSQSPQVEDLGLSGGVRANLRAIGLVAPKNVAAIEALTSTRLIPPPTGGLSELESLMSQSPVGRAVFDGKLSRWLPMPRLENHSGYDRDSRSFSSKPQPQIKGQSRQDDDNLTAKLERATGTWHGKARIEYSDEDLDNLGFKLYQCQTDPDIQAAAIHAKGQGDLKAAIGLLSYRNDAALPARDKEILQWVHTEILK